MLGYTIISTSAKHNWSTGCNQKMFENRKQRGLWRSASWSVVSYPSLWLGSCFDNHYSVPLLPSLHIHGPSFVYHTQYRGIQPSTYKTTKLGRNRIILIGTYRIILIGTYMIFMIGTYRIIVIGTYRIIRIRTNRIIHLGIYRNIPLDK